MLDLFAVSQRIPTYYSVFVACLKLICNVLSVYHSTCLISHTSAYVAAIRRSVTGPLYMHQPAHDHTCINQLMLMHVPTGSTTDTTYVVARMLKS